MLNNPLALGFFYHSFLTIFFSIFPFDSPEKHQETKSFLQGHQKVILGRKGLTLNDTNLNLTLQNGNLVDIDICIYPLSMGNWSLRQFFVHYEKLTVAWCG